MDLILNFLYSLHFHPLVFALQLLMFVAFHFLMKSVIYEPLAQARDERDGKIHKHLGAAEKAASNARDLQQRYEEELRAQRAALAHKLQNSLAEAEEQAKAALRQARDEADRITEQANVQLDQEERQLKASMEDQSTKLAVAVAQQVVKNSLEESAQSRALAHMKVVTDGI